MRDFIFVSTETPEEASAGLNLSEETVKQIVDVLKDYRLMAAERPAYSYMSIEEFRIENPCVDPTISISSGTKRHIAPRGMCLVPVRKELDVEELLEKLC